MSNDLLQRLMAAQTDEERSWIVTENLLESLPEDVATALWAVAIPHWFDGEILAALCPELADRADDIYRQLQELPCVEVFPERGHNVHELTRNQLLDRLWEDNPERFRELSDRAGAYFVKGDKSETQIEWIYHLVVSDPNRGLDALSDLAQRFDYTFRREELASLIFNLNQQLYAKRLTIKVTIELIFWNGRFKFRSNELKQYLENCSVLIDFIIEIQRLVVIQIDTLAELYSFSLCRSIPLLVISKFLIDFVEHTLDIVTFIDKSIANIRRFQGDLSHILGNNDESLDLYTKALDTYYKVNNPLGIANTLKSIGDTLVKLNSYDQSLESYKKSLDIFQENNDLLGEANTLRSIANVLQILGQKQESLENYETALSLYKNIGNRLEEASVLGKIGELLNLLERPLESLERYELALDIFRHYSDQLMIVYTLKLIGDVLKSLNRHLEALESYELSFIICKQIKDSNERENSLRIALSMSILLSIGKILELLKRYPEAFDKYKEALDSYSESQIDNEELSNALLQFKATILISMAYILSYELNRREEALKKYELVLPISRKLGDKLQEASTLQNLAILKRDLLIGLTYSKAALSIYEKLDDKINQARNLSYYTSITQIKLGQKREALISLTRAAELAQIENDESILEYANNNIAKINRELQGIWGWFDWIKSKLMR